MPAWDNVQLAGPPNGPAYINSAMNAAQTLGNLVNNGFNAYRQGQDWQYQQAQRNFFQDPNNQAMLSQALQSGNYGPLLQGIIQQGGTPAASQMLPTLIQSGASRSADQLAWGQPGGQQPVQAGPASHSSAASPANITGDFRPNPYANPNNLSAENTNDLARLADANGVDLNTFLRKYPRFQPLVDEELTDSQKQMATAAMTKLKGGAASSNYGGVNPIQPSGTDEQDVGKSTASLARSNELKPSSVQGGPPISPAPTSGGGKIRSAAPPPGAIAGDGLEDRRNIRTVQAQPTFNDRFRGMPTEAEIQHYETTGNNKLRAAGTYGLSKEKAEALKDAGNKDLEIAKQLREQRHSILKPTELESNEATGLPGRVKQRELQQIRYDKTDAGLEGAARSSEQMDRHLQTMDGILESPQLFTGAGQTNVNWLRQAAQNFLPGYNPATTLPNEALRKVTAQNLQNQVDTLRADAEEMGGSAGRIMLAQIRIMQDAAQNPDNSIPALRYLTEIGHRAVQENRDIVDLSRKYKEQHGGALDSGFDKILSNYERTHPMLTQQEERNINMVAAPRMPSNIQNEDQARSWARQHGLSAGDPIRINKSYPAQYIHAP